MLYTNNNNSHNIVISEMSGAAIVWIKPFHITRTNEWITYLLSHSYSLKGSRSVLNGYCRWEWNRHCISILLFTCLVRHSDQNKRNKAKRKKRTTKEKWWLYEYIVIIFLFLSRNVLLLLFLRRGIWVRFIWCDYYWWIFSIASTFLSRSMRLLQWIKRDSL